MEGITRRQQLANLMHCAKAVFSEQMRKSHAEEMTVLRSMKLKEQAKSNTPSYSVFQFYYDKAVERLQNMRIKLSKLENSIISNQHICAYSSLLQGKRCAKDNFFVKILQYL